MKLRRTALSLLAIMAMMAIASTAGATQHHFTLAQLANPDTVKYAEVGSGGTVDSVIIDDIYMAQHREYRLMQHISPDTVSDIIWVRNIAQRTTIVFASDNESGGFPPTYTLPDTTPAGREDILESTSLVTRTLPIAGGKYLLKISFSSDADPSSGISDVIIVQRIDGVVPAVSQWGMIALLLLLLSGGTWMLVRRRSSALVG
jgi:hypothetical protein